MRQLKNFRSKGGIPQRILTKRASNMRIALAHVEGKVDISLRFGQPLREQRLDQWRAIATFAPGAICCTVRWFGIECGGPNRQLLVLRAPEADDATMLIEGVAPRAELLLRAIGDGHVQRMLTLIECVEHSGVDPCALPAAYWRRVAANTDRSHVQASTVHPSLTGATLPRKRP